MKRYLIVTMFAALVGCGVKAPFEGRHDPYASSQINISTAIQNDMTAFGTSVPVRDDNGILHVTVPIRSTTNEYLYVDYRYTFFDRNGAQLSQSGWMTKTLTPNVPDQVEFASSTPRAADFHVDFRPAK